MLKGDSNSGSYRNQNRPFFLYFCAMTDKKILLFDMGGVLLNINYQLTINAFEKLGIDNFDQMYSQADQSGLFDKIEKGEISSFEFINGLLDYLPKTCSANNVVHAWNAMLLNFPIERLTFLENLSKTHTLYLLSNTNEIHVEKALRILKEVTDKPLDQYFTKIFWSHELGDRKPHGSAFQKVLDTIDTKAEEVLFVDDSLQHVEGARSIGIEAVHLQGEIMSHPSFS